MSQERWDVDLLVLTGSLASMGTRVLRGPVIPIGSGPGPTGFTLTGYRGIDKRHCVIAIYGPEGPTVTPVGSNQVRVAPYPPKDWKTIDRIPGQVNLNTGCAIHLGNPGSGCTLQLVTFRRVGQWTEGAIQSDGSNIPSNTVAEHVVPDTRPTLPKWKILGVQVSRWPGWILGCMSVMLVANMSIVGAVLCLTPPQSLDLEELPLAKQERFYTCIECEDSWAEPASSTLVQERLEPFELAFYRFVAQPNANHAYAVGERKDTTAITEPANWDGDLLRYVVASFEDHLRTKKVLQRLEHVKDYYRTVLTEMRDVPQSRGGPYPDVFAAIPFLESRYRPNATSHLCALGWWQLMPEHGPRAQQYGLNLAVRDCRIVGPDGSVDKWTPTAASPVVNVAANARYVGYRDNGDTYCAIKNPLYGGKGVCGVDYRTSLRQATQVAIADLEKPWTDKTLAASGAAVQISILSHNAGWDATLFGGPPKPTNLKRAYARWNAKQSPDMRHKFYGENLKCKKSDDKKSCAARSVLLPRLQHYAYPIIAEHLLAVCYYGTNHAERSEIFKEYRDKFVGGDRYCEQARIPKKHEL